MSKIVFVAPDIIHSHNHVVHPGSDHMSRSSDDCFLLSPIKGFYTYFGISNDSDVRWGLGRTDMMWRIWPKDIEEWAEANCRRPILIVPHPEHIDLYFMDGTKRRDAFVTWARDRKKKHHFSLLRPDMDAIQKFADDCEDETQIFEGNAFFRDEKEAAKFKLLFHEQIVC